LTAESWRGINLRMVNINIVSTTVGVVLGLILTVLPCIAAEKQDTKRTPPLPPPKELEVLDVYIGSWTEEIVHKPHKVIPDGLTGEKQWTGKRILDGHFIEVTGTTTYPTGVIEGRLLYTFDQTLKKYRTWGFSTGGFGGELIGDYDPKTQTMTWEAVHLPNGRKSTVEERFSADKITTHHRVWTGDGTLDWDSSTTAIRVKDKAPEPPKTEKPAANP
jgi:hypothetical protein